MSRTASILALTASVLTLAPSMADQVILRDGTMAPVEDASLANAGDAVWPGWLALRRTITTREEERAGSMLALDDGQVIGGNFSVAEDSLWWRSRALGACQVDLERIAWIGPPELVTQSVPARDRLSLVNGDHVEGFVNALQADRGVEIETGTGGDATTRTWYELSRVASIQLAPRPRTGSGWRFWLRDGTVVDADAWKREGSRITLQGLHLPGAAPRVTIAWDEVLGVRRAGAPLVALASLPWRASDPVDTPRLAPAQASVDASIRALDLRPVDLHGPGTFTTRVPEGRWVLDLRLTAPPPLATRAGCTVQVLAGDRELTRARIGPGVGVATVHAAVQGGELRVVISEPAHGPFGAAVRLDDALLVPVIEDAASPSPAPTTARGSAAGSADPG